jgi:hypothetical protein
VVSQAYQDPHLVGPKRLEFLVSSVSHRHFAKFVNAHPRSSADEPRCSSSEKGARSEQSIVRGLKRRVSDGNHSRWARQDSGLAPPPHLEELHVIPASGA